MPSVLLLKMLRMAWSATPLGSAKRMDLCANKRTDAGGAGVGGGDRAKAGRREDEVLSRLGLVSEITSRPRLLWKAEDIGRKEKCLCWAGVMEQRNTRKNSRLISLLGP